MNQVGPVWEGSDIVVALGHEATGELTDALVDVDENGEVLGIEVLGLFARYPGLTIAGEPRRLRADGDRFAIFRSNGPPEEPDCYHNLRANPKARIEVGTHVLDVMAGP